MGKLKYTRWILNKTQCRTVAVPVIKSSNHLQNTQKSNPRQKSLYSNSGAKAHELQWGGRGITSLKQFEGDVNPNSFLHPTVEIKTSSMVDINNT